MPVTAIARWRGDRNYRAASGKFIDCNRGVFCWPAPVIFLDR
jgi:hypothetical protein